MITQLTRYFLSFRKNRFILTFLMLTLCSFGQTQPVNILVNGIGANPYNSNILIRDFDSTIFPMPQTGTIVHIIGQGSANARFSFDNYYNNGVQGSVIQGRRARGWLSKPLPPNVGDVLLALTGDGYGIDSFSNRATVSVSFLRDSGVYNNTSKPSRIRISTTPEGSTTQRDALLIDRNGSFWYPLATPGIMRINSFGRAYEQDLTANEVNTAVGLNISNSLAAKTDTGTAYTKSQSNALYALDVKYTDTSAMLLAYRNAINANSPTGKLNISDTSGMLAAYRAAINGKISANQTITLSGDVTGSGSTAITTTLAAVGTAGTYNGSVTTDSKGRVISGTNESFNTSPGRLLSTTGTDNTFTVSATKNARVRYTINFAFSLTLATSNGYVQLDYSTNGGSTWITAGSCSNVYSLSVTLAGNTDAQLSADIPAGALVRLYRINATNVTVTMPITKQIEVTY